MSLSFHSPHPADVMVRSCLQELMPGSAAEHGIAAKGGSSRQLTSWLSGLGKKGKGDLDEVGCLISLHPNDVRPCAGMGGVIQAMKRC